MIISHNIKDHYWHVENQIFSSKTMNWVAEIPEGFPGIPTTISGPDLFDLLKPVLEEDLVELDRYLPRGLEDTWDTLDLDISTLPQVQQDRLSQKTTIRNQISTVRNILTQE